jgi:hypothetical protein
MVAGFSATGSELFCTKHYVLVLARHIDTLQINEFDEPCFELERRAGDSHLLLT